jgi:peptidoglycan/xylan/chitin deacetylase (PgdA/CDA1 family)
MEKGVFVLSLDTELAWGCCFDKKKIERNNRYYIETRGNIRALLNLLEKYEISATWCVVGHLFLSSCTPVNGIAHPEIVRPHYSWLNQDWLAGDPCSDIDAAPSWYGQDIIESIQNCRIPQEIACHTFSHIIVGDPGCHQECLDSELKVCRDLAEKSNITLKSFSFPRNKENYIASLADNGFIAYRGRERQWYFRYPKIVQKLAYALDNLLFCLPPPVDRPRKGYCWNIRGSWFYGHSDGMARLLPVSCRVLKINNGIKRAARENAVFHLWFHPFNLASNPRGLLAGLERVFSYVKRMKDKGEIENLTMGALAEKMEISGG